MTEEEFRKVPFLMVSHMSMVNGHVYRYVSNDYPISFERFTYYTDEKGRTRRKTKNTYLIKSKVYRSYRKAVEAVKDIPYITK